MSATLSGFPQRAQNPAGDQKPSMSVGNSLPTYENTYILLVERISKESSALSV